MLEKANKPLTVQGMLDYAKDNGTVLYKVPYFQLLRDFSEKINDHSLSKLTRTINVMALSASMAVLDFDTTYWLKPSNISLEQNQRLPSSILDQQITPITISNQDLIPQNLDLN